MYRIGRSKCSFFHAGKIQSERFMDHLGSRCCHLVDRERDWTGYCDGPNSQRLGDVRLGSLESNFNCWRRGAIYDIPRTRNHMTDPSPGGGEVYSNRI